MNKSENNTINPILIISPAVVVSLIVILFILNSLIGIENFSDQVSLPLYIIVPGILVLLSILALTQSHKIKEISKWSLLFLTLSFIASLAAEQTWNLYEHVLDIDPYPSIADLFYLSAPILMFVSLVIFLRPISHKIPKKNILFAIMISIIVLVPSIIITLDVNIEDNPIEITIALAYPIVGATLIIPAVIAILFSVQGEKNFFWLMIIIGIIVIFTADTIFLFLIIDDSYEDGHPVDILWVTGYTIWAFMMYHILHNSKKIKLEESNGIYKNYKIGKFQKFGVVWILVLVNISIAIILISINSFLGTKENTISSYFSWFLMIMVMMFSGVIISLNSKLNKTLQTRTTKLEKISDDLIKAERFSAIGELSAKISHDIRNPLSIIKVATDMISMKTKKIEGIEVEDHVDMINKSISRIVHQIDDVLGFLRTRQKDLENNILEDIVNDSLKGIVIPEQIIIMKNLKRVKFVSDYFQIQTVLTNLILNAIQSLVDKGGVVISGKKINGNTIIEVSDSGKGVPKEDLENIFKPLFTTKQKGTGLGLSSCQTIIESHNGTITYSNNPSTFKIIIPKLELEPKNDK
ncbi:MAG: GHKL domain-containing protein [Nitrosopumilus sp.]|nr:ATP-binding protein [Nitrosopumilus sp.]NRA05780.1 GHKL domain-containing protein [Nitrosopumilus sp.]